MTKDNEQRRSIANNLRREAMYRSGGSLAEWWSRVFECIVCGNRVDDLEHCCITGTFNCCPMCEREVVS